jgi:hypothetical protein
MSVLIFPHAHTMSVFRFDLAETDSQAAKRVRTEIAEGQPRTSVPQLSLRRNVNPPGRGPLHGEAGYAIPPQPQYMPRRAQGLDESPPPPCCRVVVVVVVGTRCSAFYQVDLNQAALMHRQIGFAVLLVLTRQSVCGVAGFGLANCTVSPTVRRAPWFWFLVPR